MHNKPLIIFSLSIFLSSPVCFCYAQSFESDFKIIARWHFPNNQLTGYIFDGFVDKDGQLAILSFRDGLTIISSSTVENLTRIGQGPGEMEHWAALYLNEPYLIDVERSGKLIYFKKNNGSYRYEKTEWLGDAFNFPIVKGATFAHGKWYLAGFSSVINKKNNVCGYFLSIYEKAQLIKRLFYKDFKGLYRGPYLLNAHIRFFEDRIWMMLASEPEIQVFDATRDVLLKKIILKMPEFYKQPKDYIPFKRDALDKVIKIYENWERSYSRIENFIVNEKNLIIQIRTADPDKPKFALLFFNHKKFTLERIYFCQDLLLAEKGGNYYFFEKGDPGLDEEVTCLSIKVYREK